MKGFYEEKRGDEGWEKLREGRGFKISPESGTDGGGVRISPESGRDGGVRISPDNG